MSMTLNEYQIGADATALELASGGRGSPLNGLVYCALAMNGEAGKFAENVEKAWRDGEILDVVKAGRELGDVLWYVSIAAARLGLTLEEVATMNRDKLLDRQARDVLRGRGDDR